MKKRITTALCLLITLVLNAQISVNSWKTTITDSSFNSLLAVKKIWHKEISEYLKFSDKEPTTTILFHPVHVVLDTNSSLFTRYSPFTSLNINYIDLTAALGYIYELIRRQKYNKEEIFSYQKKSDDYCKDKPEDNIFFARYKTTRFINYILDVKWDEDVRDWSVTIHHADQNFLKDIKSDKNESAFVHCKAFYYVQSGR